MSRGLQQIDTTSALTKPTNAERPVSEWEILTPQSPASPMKTIRTFKGSWFLCAVAVVILIAEFAAWMASSYLGLRNHPLVIAFLAAGLVAAMASVLYEGADVE